MPSIPAAPISSVDEIVAEIRSGHIVILVDDEGRENEGDLTMAADFVTPEAINFMVTHARGLVCLPMARTMCERLNLPPMTSRNGARYATAFTVSIEAAEGISTGISASDRAHTIRTAVARNAKASDLVQPGHIFPLQAADGGVLMRAGHTEAGCDLAQMAGCTPAAVICEVMNDDGSMARLPDLQLFAARHGLKIGTIADLIEYRSRTESLIERIGQRAISTPFGDFELQLFRDLPGHRLHMALLSGQWNAQDSVLVRVHEPLSVLDLLERGREQHAWSLDASLRAISDAGKGIAVLLNCGESAEDLLAQFRGEFRPAHAPQRGKMDLRTYGIGAQILRECGVRRMQLLGQPRRMPSMAGYGLEVTGHIVRS